MNIQATTVRMNISVPIKLKEQMNAVDSQFNWSKIASEAFLQAMKAKEAESGRSRKADCRP